MRYWLDIIPHDFRARHTQNINIRIGLLQNHIVSLIFIQNLAGTTPKHYPSKIQEIVAENTI